MPIVMVRIDDRYIHGQVATAWTQYVNANHIYVINNGVAGNKMTRMVLEMAKPQRSKLTIMDLEEGTNHISEAVDSNDNIMILYGNPEDVAWTIEQGISFDVETIILGFLRHEPGKKPLKRGGQIYVNESNIQALKSINKAGYKLLVQKVPGERAHDAMRLLEGLN